MDEARISSKRHTCKTTKDSPFCGATRNAYAANCSVYGSPGFLVGCAILGTPNIASSVRHYRCLQSLANPRKPANRNECTTRKGGWSRMMRRGRGRLPSRLKENTAFRPLRWCMMLMAIAVGGLSGAQELVIGAEPMEKPHVRPPETDYEIVPGRTELLPLDGSSGQALLVAIEAWLSSQFDLPDLHEHPRIEFANPSKIVALRFKGLLSEPNAQGAVMHPGAVSA